MLKRVGSVVESTQLWWSVRPHHAFGTVEVRICDAQASAGESTALAGLMVAVVAQTALDLDSGANKGQEPLKDREIEENFWRAIRYGMDGRLVDFRLGREVEARQALEDLLEWSSPAREGLGIDVLLPEKNGSQRARSKLASGQPIERVYAESVEESRDTYTGSLD